MNSIKFKLLKLYFKTGWTHKNWKHNRHSMINFLNAFPTSSDGKRAPLLTTTSWGSGQSSSASEGASVVHPENWAAGTGEVISRSDCAQQTPHHLSCSDLGRAKNSGPTESAPLRTTQVPKHERLRPGRCMHPRAILGRFPAEQPRAWAVWPGRAHAPRGRAHAPRARAGPVWLRYCEHTPVLFVYSVPPSPQCNWKSEPKKIN